MRWQTSSSGAGRRPQGARGRPPMRGPVARGPRPQPMGPRRALRDGQTGDRRLHGVSERSSHADAVRSRARLRRRRRASHPGTRGALRLRARNRHRGIHGPGGAALQPAWRARRVPRQHRRRPRDPRFRTAARTPPGSLGALLYTVRRRYLRRFWKIIRGGHPLEMHCLPRAQVEQLVGDSGGSIVDVLDVSRKGKRGRSFRYCAIDGDARRGVGAA